MRATRRDRRSRARPRGTVLVIVAIMLVALTGFAALAVDIGVLTTARAQLKAVTDAAALAGARQLASDRRISSNITSLTPEMTAATAQAIAVGNANSVLGKGPQLTTSNVVIGYKNVRGPNPDSPDAAVNTGVSSTLFNSVEVTATVAVAALFSAPFRPGGSTVSVTSTATVEVVNTKGFLSRDGSNAYILPMVMDQVAYLNMMAGTGGDSYTFGPSNYNPPNSNGVANGADGVKESVTYPVASGLSGNWGTIDFGISSNSTQSLGAQITGGITPAQMQAEYPGGSVTVPHQFSANPGISAGVKSDLDSIIGRAVTVPIYDTSGGNGNNAWYHVVKFASVRVVAVNLTGSDKYVIVQPAISDDQTAIPDTSSPNTWSQGGAIFLHLSR